MLVILWRVCTTLASTKGFSDIITALEGISQAVCMPLLGGPTVGRIHSLLLQFCQRKISLLLGYPVKPSFTMLRVVFIIFFVLNLCLLVAGSSGAVPFGG